MADSPLKPFGARQLREYIEHEGKITAIRRVQPTVESESQANAVIGTYFQRLLYARQYAAAGVLMFGEKLFNPKVKSVNDIIDLITNHSRSFVMAGAAQGKSWTGIAVNFLDWCADPDGTNIKLISTTGGHARSNSFDTVRQLHSKSLIPMIGVLGRDSLKASQGDERGAISIVRIREGEDNSGVLQGFHPTPRTSDHPVFGSHTRVRSVFDEAEEIPNGVWTGAENMLSTADESDSTKAMGFFNPKDISSKTAELCEPPTGWGDFDSNTGYMGKDRWTSKKGWQVLWIDPEKTENVRQRKTVHFGFQTYEGNRAYKEAGGGNSLAWWAFGKGVYPPEGFISAIFTQKIINDMVGEFVFTSPTITGASLDTALNGRDDTLINFAKERDVIQVDQQFVVKKGDTSVVARDFRDQCIALNIDPTWTMIDSTGNGEAVLGLLQSPDFWGSEAKGLCFSKPSTDTKVLQEDNEMCSDLYENVASEIWFAAAKLAEFGYIGISPILQSGELPRQLVGRQYILGELKKKKVEDKKIYKKRLSRSPDHADSFLIGIHLFRTHKQITATMIDIKDSDSKRKHLEHVRMKPQPQDDNIWLSDSL